MARENKEGQAYKYVIPEHYLKSSSGQQLIDVLEDQLSPEEFRGFCKGLIIKYLVRAEHKNGMEDYNKAKYYLDELIDFLNKQSNKEVK